MASSLFLVLVLSSVVAIRSGAHAQMLIGAAGWLSGYDGAFDFKQPGQLYGDTRYVGMRVVCMACAIVLTLCAVPMILAELFLVSATSFLVEVAVNRAACSTEQRTSKPVVVTESLAQDQPCAGAAQDE